MILLYLRPCPETCKFYISGVSPVPCDVINVITPAVDVTVAELATSRGVLPFCLCGQPVTIRSRIDGYGPFDLIEIAELRVRQIILFFLRLVHLVIRLQAFFYAPFITVLNSVIPIDSLYRQVVAHEFGKVTSHYFNPFFLSYFIPPDIEARNRYTFAVVVGFCVLECSAMNQYEVIERLSRTSASEKDNQGDDESFSHCHFPLIRIEK